MVKNNENSFKTNLFLSLKLSDLLPTSRGTAYLSMYLTINLDYLFDKTALFGIAINPYLEGFQRDFLSLIISI